MLNYRHLIPEGKAYLRSARNNGGAQKAYEEGCKQLRQALGSPVPEARATFDKQRAVYLFLMIQWQLGTFDL